MRLYCMDQESHKNITESTVWKTETKRWVYETTELLPGNFNISKDSFKTLYLNKIWKLRIMTLRELFLDGYSVFISDIDSIWNKKVELKDLPSNFDMIAAVCTQPRNVLKDWSFTICAGVSYYRPTEKIVNFFDALWEHCTNLPHNKEFCNDQHEINKFLMAGDIKWYNANETEQEKHWQSPIGYHKIGVASQVESKMSGFEIMVMSRDDVMRAGGVDNCARTWIMNPIANGFGSANKLRIFKKHQGCFESQELERLQDSFKKIK